jgi:Protein of unknown function (DUF998)
VLKTNSVIDNRKLTFHKCESQWWVGAKQGTKSFARLWDHFFATLRCHECFFAMQWNGYSSATQTVSELSAIGTPTRTLWVPLGIAYSLLAMAFGWGIWESAGRNRRLRIVGGLMVVSGIIGPA